MQRERDIVGRLAAEMTLHRDQVQRTVTLLDEGNTIPFVARYRKEMTGSLDDLGCPLNDPFLTLITLTGAAIPYLRICEEGLVNLKDGKTLGLLV